MNLIADISNDPITGEIRKIEVQLVEARESPISDYKQYLVAGIVRNYNGDIETGIKHAICNSYDISLNYEELKSLEQEQGQEAVAIEMINWFDAAGKI